MGMVYTRSNGFFIQDDFPDKKLYAILRAFGLVNDRMILKILFLDIGEM